MSQPALLDALSLHASSHLLTTARAHRCIQQGRPLSCSLGFLLVINLKLSLLREGGGLAASFWELEICVRTTDASHICLCLVLLSYFPVCPWLQRILPLLLRAFVLSLVYCHAAWSGPHLQCMVSFEGISCSRCPASDLSRVNCQELP